jgi:ABC-type Na+ transport system ATPase subunit NatA
MVKTLEQAIAEVTQLPDADQEQIGRQLLSHVEKLRSLREELDKGVRSLNAGMEKRVDIDKFVRQKTK